MAPEVLRLKRRADFLRVAATRKKWVAPGLILQVRRHSPGERISAPESAVRVGFTVSRKVGNAVERNRARRRLRAASDRILPVYAKEGIDFVIIGRAATLKRPFSGLISDLKTALKRLDAYSEPDTTNETP